MPASIVGARRVLGVRLSAPVPPKRQDDKGINYAPAVAGPLALLRWIPAYVCTRRKPPHR